MCTKSVSGKRCFQETTDLANSVFGTLNQITVTDNNGTITLSTPQDISTNSNVQFNQVDTVNVTSSSGILTIREHLEMLSGKNITNILGVSTFGTVSLQEILRQGGQTGITPMSVNNASITQNAFNSFEIRDGNLVGCVITISEHSTTQSISNGTDIAVEFDTDIIDSGNRHNHSTTPAVFTYPSSKTQNAKWIVSWSVRIAGTDTGLFRTWLEKSGSTQRYGIFTKSGYTLGDQITSTTIVEMTPGQTISVYVYQDSSGSFNIGSSNVIQRNQINIVEL